MTCRTGISDLAKRALDSQSEHAIIVIDDGGVIQEWNQAACEIFGYTREEALGRSYMCLFVPEDVERGEHVNELASARSYGVGEDDRWMLRNDGSRFWAVGAVTLLKDERGSAGGFVKVLRDRTDLRHQLDTLRNRLEAAQRAVSRKNVFNAALAHELRSPLAALTNSLRVIELMLPGEIDISKPISVIERQVRLISRLMSDLADFARAEEDKLTLDLEIIDMRTVIDRVTETCSGALLAKQQTVDTIAAGPVELQGDALRLNQVFVNLVVNASKFSPPGATIWIKITIEGNEAVVRVEDKGMGIPEEFLPRVFDLFTRAGSSPHDLGEQGMGLGLPLVKSFVELHHGTVQVRSEGSGKGAEVTVRLPIAQPTGWWHVGEPR
jgi:two-component system CheB/CheR fusion protein